MYRAVINLDFTGQRPNAYAKLVSALLQAGWERMETSALAIETEDLNRIWVGSEVVAKQAGRAGTLSAYTLQVQRLGDPQPYAAAANHQTALEDILGLDPPRID